MIAKNKKGKSFGGCVRYVMNDGHEILEAEGVLAEDAASIIRDFAIQRSGRPEVKQPVGHIPISFSPEDSQRLTNDFMVQLAGEYMAAMGIRNTQFIIVRHRDTSHPHIHIVYSRIDNDLKLISINNDYKRNVKVCKRLKDKYGLTYGEGKEKVRREKLTGTDKVKYQIHDEIAANLPKCVSYADLEKRLRQSGIVIRYKYRSGAEELPENIQGISFEKNGIALKGSEIDRKFSHANLKNVFEDNQKPQQLTPEERKALNEFDISKYIPDMPKPKLVQQLQKSDQAAPEPSKPTRENPSIGGVELTDEQDKILRAGGSVFLENMEKKDGSGKFSSYVFLNDEKKKAFFSNENPDKMVEYGETIIRLRDKILVERGEITKAKMKWWGGIDFQDPFVWKDPQSGEIKYSFDDPRISKEQLEKEKQQSENRRQRPPTPSRTVPPPRKTPPKRTIPPPKGPKHSR